MNNKRVNKETLFVITAFVVCIAFVNFLCIAFPALKVTYETSAFILEGRVEGLMAIAGGTVSAGSTTSNFNLIDAKFNPISLIGYLLPLVACALALLALSKKSQILYYVTGSICLIAGVITLLEGVIFKLINNITIMEVSLLLGPIMGGICGIVAGFISFGSWYVFNKK